MFTIEEIDEINKKCNGCKYQVIIIEHPWLRCKLGIYSRSHKKCPLLSSHPDPYCGDEDTLPQSPW